MPQRVSKDNFQSEVLSADTLVLADFYSDSCIPCKRLSPVLFELEKEYEGKLKIAKINVNFDSELASEYEVQAAPTLVFLKNGEEKERLRGAVKKSEIIEVTEKLMEICDAALNFFAENAKPSERFKFTIDRVGREKFEQRILEVYNG